MVPSLSLARSATRSRAAAEKLAPVLPVIAVLGGGAIACLWYSSLLIARDAGLRTPAYDQAFFQQLVWNLDHGHWFQSSFTSGSFLGLHFEPLLIFPAILELVWPDPRLLSLLAAVSIAALGPAAYLFLRVLIAKPQVAAVLAAPLPLWPALQQGARAGFHPEMIGLDLVLLAGWAGLRGRTRLCWLLACLSLTAKEDQGWNLLIIGLVLATVPLRRRLGISLASVAIVWSFSVTAVAMPILRAGHHVDTDSYYGWLGGASPAALFHALTYASGWQAVLVMLLCAGGLSLLQPKWVALAVPPFFADLLSSHQPQPALHLQYALPIVIPVLIAAVMAIRSITVRPPVLAAIAGMPLVLALSAGALPPAIGVSAAPFEQASAVNRLANCTSVVPADASIAGDDSILQWLASRPAVHELTAASPSDYLVIDRRATNPAYVVASKNPIGVGHRTVLCDDGRFTLAAPDGEEQVPRRR